MVIEVSVTHRSISVARDYGSFFAVVIWALTDFCSRKVIPPLTIATKQTPNSACWWGSGSTHFLYPRESAQVKLLAGAGSRFSLHCHRGFHRGASVVTRRCPKAAFPRPSCSRSWPQGDGPWQRPSHPCRFRCSDCRRAATVLRPFQTQLHHRRFKSRVTPSWAPWCRGSHRAFPPLFKALCGRPDLPCVSKRTTRKDRRKRPATIPFSYWKSRYAEASVAALHCRSHRSGSAGRKPPPASCLRS